MTELQRKTHRQLAIDLAVEDTRLKGESVQPDVAREAGVHYGFVAFNVLLGIEQARAEGEAVMQKKKEQEEVVAAAALAQEKARQEMAEKKKNDDDGELLAAPE